MMVKQNISLVVILAELLLAVASNGVCSPGSCQAHDICAKDSDCAADLKCTNCSSADDMNYRCTRFSVTDPVSQVGDLPFNRYSWLTTHNSFAIVGEKSYTGTERITFCNQEDSVTNQLNNGVRGLMLDMYDFENDVWLCHSNGTCFNVTAFMPAIITLKEIAAFLAANPSEIITIFIEDYVKAPKGLTKVFTAAGLMKYWFPVSRMPQNGEDWPTVNDMISKNQRLIVFTSQSSKEASEGIAYEWKYVVENQYGDEGLLNGSCVNRAESKNLTSKSQSLFLENFFPTIPSIPETCSVNSDRLSNMLNVCYEKAGKRWANFLAVNFYKRSYGGGAFQAVDKLNGQLICGRNDITECQANVTSGVCNNRYNTKVSPMGSAST
ncbi:PI-PLC X domain-containing protein At5g67130 isoform X1 [Cryptomeria japonica]|uniref:PI-PLC X domain-containing protein At5g67130 isoform X1 n=1 Tax=Cryptomeria japonica TaxID=3369 RepID=UPI0027DA0BF0|nr:PI-PLC X domain-containing protein At5g67130 isoform X1 [Cryptomeria japonica]XP_057852376.2 PI-PLC X domain-containing protein At5g67130 isoform X1 [Cryptomeria japonica]XP_057852380.2 PI-PLC X domain-containing protein At5g67130 isoform X1 [Cryptomeria japonica]XP_057852388.2 PI-PLC X domain-containing protein At5g67130 isoform X1 [Cryptomeria japonica]XP_057852395.2 PI-PLC X domain-containing protein At5g67130 isoform X1 [Cryptomeria japonica]XP_057852404.2 PI-PLC X domain-containing pro